MSFLTAAIRSYFLIVSDPHTFWKKIIKTEVRVDDDDDSGISDIDDDTSQGTSGIDEDHDHNNFTRSMGELVYGYSILVVYKSMGELVYGYNILVVYRSMD